MTCALTAYVPPFSRGPANNAVPKQHTNPNRKKKSTVMQKSMTLMQQRMAPMVQHLQQSLQETVQEIQKKNGK